MKCFNFLKSIDLANKLYGTKDKKLVGLIKVRWSNLKDETGKMSKEEIENEKPKQILETVNEILDFNKDIQEQRGSGLKILTPNQRLSRLPISLAQLKAGKILRNLKMKLGNYYILYTDQKNLQSNSIKVWLTLFKNGNNLYGH